MTFSIQGLEPSYYERIFTAGYIFGFYIYLNFLFRFTFAFTQGRFTFFGSGEEGGVFIYIYNAHFIKPSLYLV